MRILSEHVNINIMAVTKQTKFSIPVDEEQFREIEEGIALKAQRLGMATKPKTAAMLRDVLVLWAREEKQRSQEGTLFEK